jgi:hypothetical protein
LTASFRAFWSHLDPILISCFSATNYQATDTDKYWIRRGQRWDVKKKVGNVGIRAYQTRHGDGLALESSSFCTYFRWMNIHSNNTNNNYLDVHNTDNADNTIQYVTIQCKGFDLEPPKNYCHLDGFPKPFVQKGFKRFWRVAEFMMASVVPMAPIFRAILWGFGCLNMSQHEYHPGNVRKP